jgi:hypothetical protein
MFIRFKDPGPETLFMNLAHGRVQEGDVLLPEKIAYWLAALVF